MKTIIAEDNVRAQVRCLSSADILARKLVVNDGLIDSLLSETAVDILAGAISTCRNRETSSILTVISDASDIEMSEFHKIGHKTKTYVTEEPAGGFKPVLTALLTRIRDKELAGEKARLDDRRVLMAARTRALNMIANDVLNDSAKLAEITSDLLTGVIMDSHKNSKTEELLSSVIRASDKDVERFKALGYNTSTYLIEEPEGGIKIVLVDLLSRVFDQELVRDKWIAELDQCSDTHLHSTILTLNELFNRGQKIKIIKEHADFIYLAGFMGAVAQAGGIVNEK